VPRARPHNGRRTRGRCLLSFGTLALIVAVGLLGPALALLPSRISPPIVIGEIAAGVALGRSGTHSINPTQPTLAFLADIGFALLMFIVGTHLPVRENRLLRASRRGGIAVLITVALAAVGGPLIAWPASLNRPAIIAALLATSSAAIVLPIVQNRFEGDCLVLVAWVSALDLITVLAVPLVMATGGIGKAVGGSALVIVGAALIGGLGWYLGGTRPVDRLQQASREHGFALDLRVSLLALFTLAWIAERFDTSVLIAGFAAGVAVAALGPPDRVAQQLIGLGEGFFVPLFFVVLGARLDLGALFRSRDDLLLLLMLTAGTVVVHVTTMLVMKLPLAYGLLGSAQLGVPSAIAAIGLTTHQLRPGQGAAIVGAAAISLAIAAVGATMAGYTPTPSRR
jgi:Kef-type K+ transport system membrane component KefB